MEKTKEKKQYITLLSGIVSYVIPFVGIWRIAKKKEGSVGAKITTSIVFMILWLYSLFFLGMMFWTFYNSMKLEGFLNDMMSFPDKLDFSNYMLAYKNIIYNRTTFLGMFFNSIWFSAGSAFLTIFFHAITGYIFAKYDFPGKEAAFTFILFTLALPIVGSLPSLYDVVYKMGINDSPLFLLNYVGGFGGNFLIMYSYFKGIDKTYMEAADIDGAGRFQIFFKIMLPLAIAPSYSLFLVTFINQWNNYETAILFLENMPPLASGLYYFGENMLFYEGPGDSNTIYLAGVLLAALPVVIAVACFGDKLMSNISMGGIKG